MIILGQTCFFCLLVCIINHLAYPEIGLFGLFFQPEQYFSLTTIQPEQCFQSVSVKFQQAEQIQSSLLSSVVRRLY